MSAAAGFSKRRLEGARHRSMPLIIPDDTTYDISTNDLELIPGKPRTGLELVPETLSMVRSIEKPLAVLAIGGPCRTGKSYVLSRLLDSADDFALGHTMDAKTFGIWIGTTVLECDKFTVLLMDTEGIDAVSAKAKDDASILVMTVLLSSYFIYNSVGVPKKNDLQKMSHFAKLATSIAVSDVDSPETFDLKKYFPDFLWLLRDAILAVPPGRDGKPMTPSDYLKTKVFKRGASFNESDSDKVGRAILTVFPTIECMTIEAPSTDPEVMQNIVLKQDCLNPRFNEQIERLVAYLLSHVRAKNGFLEGKLVDGPLLAEIASCFLRAVNSPDAIPCITDTWQAAVELRCKKALEQMLEEYTQELEAKIKEVGLPMEEDSLDDGDVTKPCTLMGIHRSILLQKTELLLKQVGHFVGGPVLSADDSTPAFNRESLIAELEKCTAVFAETDDSVSIEGFEGRKKRLVGGILHNFAQLNYSKSRSHCLAVFEALYKQIEDKMKEMEHYTFKNLMGDLTALHQEYDEKAVGPAKWEVYTEKESFIKSQEENYKRLDGFKKKKFDADQKVAEEKAKNDRLNDSLNQVQVQMSKDAQLNKKRMEAMQEQHEIEMNRMREERNERMENDRTKYDDFMKAQLDNMAEIIKDNKEAMKEQYDVMFKSMEKMGEQNQANLTAVNKTVEVLKEAIEKIPKPEGGCFQAGTVVKLSDGRELSIEKQSGGMKILALGGEITTITDEFVDNTLDAGQKLFGFNEDAPFAALHHPFWTTEGWKCLDPVSAKEENPDIDFKKLQVGDILFRVAKTNPFLYEPIQIKQFTFMTLEEPTKIYGLHLDGPRSYHANGYAVMANYPVLTKKRVQDAMKKLGMEEREHLRIGISSVKAELTKVLGSWADSALNDMGLTESTMDD